ncbi:MAG: hypothetical protein M2R46_00167 [Verrucomicrobia subdivision 3 bacterium]|nr:hypothetical protein [Limisphaerales bacterium]
MLQRSEYRWVFYRVHPLPVRSAAPVVVAFPWACRRDSHDPSTQPLMIRLGCIAWCICIKRRSATFLFTSKSG